MVNKKLDRKWYYLILSIPLIIGLLIILEGYYHPKLGFLLPIGVSVISGTIVGFFMSLTTTEITSIATTRAALNIQGRIEHLNAIKNVLRENGSPIQAVTVRNLLTANLDALTPRQRLDRDLLMDIKAHWPNLFDRLIKYVNTDEENSKKIDQLRENSIKVAEQIASESLDELNQDIINADVFSTFFQGRVSISNKNNELVKISGDIFKDSTKEISSTITSGLFSREINETEPAKVKEKMKENIKKSFEAQWRVSDPTGVGAFPRQMGNFIRASMEKNLPMPVRNQLINPGDSPEAAKPAISLLESYILANSNIEKILENGIEQITLRREINDSEKSADESIRTILMTTIIPKDCYYTKTTE